MNGERPRPEDEAAHTSAPESTVQAGGDSETRNVHQVLAAIKKPANFDDAMDYLDLEMGLRLLPLNVDGTPIEGSSNRPTDDAGAIDWDTLPTSWTLAADLSASTLMALHITSPQGLAMFADRIRKHGPDGGACVDHGDGTFDVLYRSERPMTACDLGDGLSISPASRPIPLPCENGTSKFSSGTATLSEAARVPTWLFKEVSLITRNRLMFTPIADLASRLDAAEPPRYLIRGLWPQGDYGVIAAEKKAGKSWMMADLAVSVASGTRWLDFFEIDDPGAVLLLAGEGGSRKVIRRLRAIGEHKRLAVEGLPIHTVDRVPHLTNEGHMEQVAEHLAQVPTKLVILDPFYLAAQGADSRDLFDMGAKLEVIQHVAQEADASLVVVHHWNKTGFGKGANRMSGAGTAEWGRILGSVSKEKSVTDPTTQGSIVTLTAHFEGDEIADRSIAFTRHVWEDDPGDLTCPMHYNLTEVDDVTNRAGQTQQASIQDRVLDWLTANPGNWFKTSKVIDGINTDGGPKTGKRSVQEELRDLYEGAAPHRGHTVERDGTQSTGYCWRAVPAPE